MGLFNFNKKNKQENDMNIYANLSKWIDKHLCKDLPDDVIAINFNLYEGSDDTYDVEIVGCDEFDEDDSDWACSEVFTTREDLFYIHRTSDIAEWEQALSCITGFVEKYLSDGKYADKLKSYTAVGIGFVDGDMNILYRSK